MPRAHKGICRIVSLPAHATTTAPLDLVVLASGSGTLLQAILDAAAHEGSPFTVTAVVTDRPCLAVERAENAGIPATVVSVKDHADRAAWDQALAETVQAHQPQLVVSAGFMKILGTAFLARFAGRTLNTHPALLPAFPGAHGVRDALAYGVKVTGCTVHLVDEGVDTGPILDQRAVRVEDGEDEATLHERIKVLEREMIVATLAAIADGSLDLAAAQARRAGAPDVNQ